MKTWVFRADAGSGIGLGHLRRVTTLAQAFQGHRVLVLRTENQAFVQECRAFFDDVHWLVPTATLEQELSAYPRSLSAVIVDLSHRDTIARPDYVNELFQQLRARGKLLVIDGYSHDSLRRAMKLSCDYLVTPYIGLPDERGEFVHLNGGQYFILDPRYRYQGYVCRSAVGKVLVTMGGADPFGVSAQLMQKINAHGYQLQWTLVVGPAFDARHVSELESLQEGRPWLSLEKNPKNLNSLYQSADFVFVGDGLTKYELASLGVPMGLVSSTAAGEEANAAFATRTGCGNFGRIEGLSSTDLDVFFTSPQLELQAREAQSCTGRSLVDGEGSQRIARRLL